MVEYQIILDEHLNLAEDLLKQKAITKEVKEPINLFHKIKKRLGLYHKEKVVGYYYKIELK